MGWIMKVYGKMCEKVQYNNLVNIYNRVSQIGSEGVIKIIEDGFDNKIKQNENS